MSVCVCMHVCAISKGSFPILYWSNKQSTIPLLENMQHKQESRTPPTVYVMICCLFTSLFEKKIPGIETSQPGSSPGGQADPSPRSCGVKGLRLRALLGASHC